MSKYLLTMLELLTGAYNRTDISLVKRAQPPQTNVGKLFDCLAHFLEVIEANAERMREWTSLDASEGADLDRRGMNYGVERGGANDVLYRLLIKIKMISILSGGDGDTLINAASALFDVDPSAVGYSEETCRVYIAVDEASIAPEYLAIIDETAVILQRITAAGVMLKVILRTYRSFDMPVVLTLAPTAFSDIRAAPRPVEVETAHDVCVMSGLGSVATATATQPPAADAESPHTVYYSPGYAERVHITIRPQGGV